MSKAPILSDKYYDEPTVFQPGNLLREARRQKNIPECPVPRICLLDPDGDVVRYLKETGEARQHECWACYHSEMYETTVNDQSIGIIPCAVGAPYAVLVAEQLFASGCEQLISVTSAGVISDEPLTRRFGLITESLRDEGTSYHYLPAEQSAVLPAHLRRALYPDGDRQAPYTEITSWTTDAPYRETQPAIDEKKKQGITSVEMEASALYAYAAYTGNDIACFAHLTNTMAQEKGDFEKGEHFGSKVTLELIAYVIDRLVSDQESIDR